MLIRTLAGCAGETHTFTEVDEFGGGIVPELNERMHLSTVAPECRALEPDDFVAPGQTYREDIEETGHEKYQCCVRPWMRLEANITAAQGRWRRRSCATRSAGRRQRGRKGRGPSRPTGADRRSSAHGDGPNG